MQELIGIRLRLGFRAFRQLLGGLAVEFQGRYGRDLAAYDALHVAVEAGGIFDDALEFLFALLPVLFHGPAFFEQLILHRGEGFDINRFRSDQAM